MSFVERRSVLVGAGIIAAVIGLAAALPARLALAWFSPPQLAAWGVSGTLWEGRAAELVLDGYSLGSLSWDARPLRFIAMQPTWDLSLRRGDGFAEARAGFSLLGNSQRVQDLDAALELATLPPAIVPVGVAGQARVSLQRLDLEDGWPRRLSGRAVVNQLELPGVVLALGPFEFEFPDQPGPPEGQVRSLGGPLSVDGTVALPAPGQWELNAELAPGENAPREVIEGLGFVGEDLGGGRRRLLLSSEP